MQAQEERERIVEIIEDRLGILETAKDILDGDSRQYCIGGVVAYKLLIKLINKPIPHHKSAIVNGVDTRKGKTHER